MSHPADLAATMRHAADELDRREAHHDPVKDHGYGGAVFALLHYSAQELHAAPAIEALRRHLVVDQLQFAQGGRADLLKALRECADRLDGGEFEDVPQLRESAAHRELEELRAALAEGMGFNDSISPTSVIAREAVERLGRLEKEVQRLEGALADEQRQHGLTRQVSWHIKCENDDLRGQLRLPPAGPEATPTPTIVKEA